MGSLGTETKHLERHQPRPGQFYERAAIPTGQQIVQGAITGEQAGELAATVAKEWKEFNPDMVENYRKWAPIFPRPPDPRSGGRVAAGAPWRALPSAAASARAEAEMTAA